MQGNYAALFKEVAYLVDISPQENGLPPLFSLSKKMAPLRPGRPIGDSWRLSTAWYCIIMVNVQYVVTNQTGKTKVKQKKKKRTVYSRGGQLFFPWGHMRNRKYCGGPGQKA